MRALRTAFLITAFLMLVLSVRPAQAAFAYIDPGFGSYAFQVVIAVAIASLFAIKGAWQRVLGFFTRRGKATIHPEQRHE